MKYSIEMEYKKRKKYGLLEIALDFEIWLLAKVRGEQSLSTCQMSNF